MRFDTSSKFFAVLVTLALLLPVGLWAQSLTQGAVTGTVVDASSAVLPNATIKLISSDKGYSRDATSTSAGSFSFPQVDAGNYTIEVTASGFKKYSAKIQVNVGQAANVNVKLEVGSAAGTTIEVTDAVPLLAVENADMSTVFDQTLVANLPNGGNDLTAVAYTAPGVIMNSGGGYGNFNANGLPGTSNVFTVDGENQMDPFLNLNNSGPTNLMLGKNSIEEATVTTNGYSGQYGQLAGAQVSMVSKGGTNQLHGNVGYEWTGRYLDANDWFNGGIEGPPQGAPFANNNQWSARLGGPIRKDKTFFFLDTEGIRYIVPSTQSVFAPTNGFLTDLTADLPIAGASAATIATYATQNMFWLNAPNRPANLAGNGPSTCLDGFTQTTPIIYTTGNQALDPATLAAGCFGNYNTSPALPASEWLLVGRLDQNIGNKDRAFLRFDIDRGTQATYADPIDSAAFSAASFQPEYNNALVWNHTFSGTATNQLVAAGSYYRATFIQNTGPTTSPFPYALYLVADSPVNGLNAAGVSFPQGRNVTQFQIVDDFAKTIGRHALKFGVNYRHYWITNYDASTFAIPEVVPGLNDFFNGQATEYFQNNALHVSAPMTTGGIGLYAQDDWAVTSKLKVNLSLRAEHNYNPTCNTDCFTSLNAPFSSIEQQGINTPYNQALNISTKDAFQNVDSINWAPRAGFTWSPLANGKTVVSGGIGIFYDAFPAFITDNAVAIPYLVPVGLFGTTFGLPPVYWGDPTGAAATVQATANTIRNGGPGIPSLANGLTLNQLLAAGGAPPSIAGFPNKIRTPQYQEWNFQIQQEIDSKSRVTIAYVGNHGILEIYPNSTQNATTSSGVANYAVNTPDERFGAVTEFNSGALSNHNGLTASYTRRLTAGFVVNANYTWSHTLDEISNGGFLGIGVHNILGQINPDSLRANNYGNADYDIRHSFNANYVWTEPFHFSSKAMNALLGGWLVSENFITRSGLPYTVVDGTTSISNGGTATPAQALGPAQQSCVNGFSQCFNSAQFESANGLGFFPTQVRNQYRGPAFFNSDVTVGKSVNLTERMKVSFGVNVYNVFNHPNFQNPNNAWTDPACSTPQGGSLQPSCGQITGQAAPPTGAYGSFFNGLPAGREGQLTFKMEF